jgi:hypothetical protein
MPSNSRKYQSGFDLNGPQNWRKQECHNARIIREIEYRDPKYWWISASKLHLTNIILIFHPFQNRKFCNPASGFNFPEATEERAAVLLKQEEFDPTMLLNLVGGKHGEFTVRMLAFCQHQ